MPLRYLSAACSTITVSKCQAALRTLRGFDYFSPTCLCKEPRVEPKCNQLRDFIFDHPCEIANVIGKHLNMYDNPKYQGRILSLEWSKYLKNTSNTINIECIYKHTILIE